MTLLRRTPLSRRTPLVRRTRLKSTTPLVSRSRLAPISARRLEAARVAGWPVASTLPPSRLQPAVPAKVRAAVRLRSGDRCEMARPGCLGQGTDPAHRLGLGMGGRHGAAEAEASRLANVAWACRLCHSWAHAHPLEAYATGWMLRTGEDPATEPVLYRGRLRLLADDGRVLPYEAVAS